MTSPPAWGRDSRACAGAGSTQSSPGGADTALGTLTAQLGLPGLQGCSPLVLLSAESKIIHRGKLITDLAGTQKHEAIFLSLSNQCAESVPGTVNIDVDRERVIPTACPKRGARAGGKSCAAAGLAVEGGGGCRTISTPSPFKVPSTSPECPRNLNFVSKISLLIDVDFDAFINYCNIAGKIWIRGVVFTLSSRAAAPAPRTGHLNKKVTGKEL